MKASFCFVFLLFTVIQFVNGQSLILEDSAKAIKTDLITVDQKGNLFLVDIKGNIFQYSPDLKLVRNYSPPKPFKVYQLDAWQGLRIFCFYRDIQEFSLLDRFLTSTENYQFELPNNGFISHATLSFDNNLWLLDQPSMKLVKYNINQRNTEFDIPLNNIIPVSIFNVVLFKEYQNKIYIVDEVNGIIVFDNLGNLLSIRKARIGKGVGFFGEYLYYLENDKMIWHHLYRDEITSIQLPLNRTIDKVIAYQNLIYVLEGDMIYKYSKK